MVINNNIGSATTLAHHEPTKEIKKAETQKMDLKTNQPPAKEERTTYGVPLITKMSDEEYSAFLRATKGLDEKQIERSAQTLQLIASVYQNTQNLINGGGMISALTGDQALMNDLRSLNVQKAINEGISVLKNMNENDQRQSVRLLERMAMALTQSGLNLHG